MKEHAKNYSQIVATIIISEITRYLIRKAIDEFERRDVVKTANHGGTYL